MWELDYKESWAQENWCFWTVVLQKTLESPLDCKEIQPVHPKWKSVLNIHWKDWCWSWNSNTLDTWCKELTHWKRPWCWERLKVRGEGDERGWDGWMASLTQWPWVWVNSGSWWWTGRPSVLQSMGSKESDTTEWLNWLILHINHIIWTFLYLKKVHTFVHSGYCWFHFQSHLHWQNYENWKLLIPVYPHVLERNKIWLISFFFFLNSWAYIWHSVMQDCNLLLMFSSF